MKRLIDVLASLAGLLLSAPVLAVLMLLIWLQDRHSPLYVAPRVGRYERPFRMVKLRSMIVGADKTGVDSTGSNDRRITPLGRFVRRFKLDELPQLWNVLRGDMSLVGPRPNVKRETDLYTALERRLLDVRPGITDFASIVFADEGEILKDHPDPDVGYNQLIRPGKSRLGIFYVEHRTAWLDVQLIALTAVSAVFRSSALLRIQKILEKLGADPDLVSLAGRREPLMPEPPPGSNEVVVSRP